MSDVLFRSAVGGFNKRDVADFITSQNAKYKDSLAEKDKEISLSKSKMNELKNEYESYKNEIAETAKKAQDNIALCDEIFASLLRIKSSAEELSDLNGLGGELVEKLCLGYVSKSIAVAESEGYKEKARKYDMITGLLTNCEISESKSEIFEKTTENDIRAEMLKGIDMKGYSLEDLISRQKKLSIELCEKISCISTKIGSREN